MARQRSKFTCRTSSDPSMDHLAGLRNGPCSKNVATDKAVRDGPLIIGDVDVIRYRSQVKLIAADKAYEREVRRACTNRANFNDYCRSLPCKITMYRKLSPIPEEPEGTPEEGGGGDFQGYWQEGFRLAPTSVLRLEQKLRNMQSMNPVMVDLDSFLDNELYMTDFSVISCIDSDDNNDSKESGSRAKRKKHLSARDRIQALLSYRKNKQHETPVLEESVPLPPPPEHHDSGTENVNSGNCVLDSFTHVSIIGHK